MKINSEYLLNNIIDKNMQGFLLPLNYMQSCFVLSKYKISNNFITPNGLVYHVLSFLGLIAVIFLHTYPLLTRKITNLKMSELIYLGSIFNLLFHDTSYVIVYILNTINGLDNIKLIIKIQGAHHILSMPKNVLKKYTICNWLHVIIKYPSYTMILSLYVYFVELLNIYKIFYLISTMYFDCNIVYAARLMKLLTIEMNYLKERIKRYSIISPEQENVSKQRKLNFKKITQAYLDLISAFDKFKKVFRFSVSYTPKVNHLTQVYF